MRPGLAEIPGLQALPAAPVLSAGDQLTAQGEPAGQQVQAPAGQQVGRAPGLLGADAAAGQGTAAIPGAQVAAEDAAAGLSAQPTSAYHRNAVSAAASAVPAVSAQQAFINQVAPGAIAAQRRYGIPAAVTIAQAIDESGWGQSELATQDHNLFGIKGSGPAGTDVYSTSEYENGQWVTVDAGFRVYHNIAESIADHSELLATGGAYQRAMADRDVPDAFANDLTGVYATDPNYGTNLIALMRLYNLYQYDSPAPTPAQSPAPQASPQPVAQQATAQPVAQAPAAQGAAQQVAQIGVVEPAMPGVVAVQAGQGTAHGGGQRAAAGRGEQAAAHGAVRGAAAARGGAAQGTPVARGGAAAQRGGTAGGGAVLRGGSNIPGDAYPLAAALTVPAVAVGSARRRTGQAEQGGGRSGRPARPARITTRRYVPQIPVGVSNAFVTTAKGPLAQAEALYRDVATQTGVRWELLAACDWMQCEAQPRYSPVHGERLGTRNADGSVYRTKADALMQCADELIDLAWAVYHIDLTAGRALSVRSLASVFAAFRWGGLLRAYEISVLDFPYSVAGLTARHMRMRWPDADIPEAPDKPGTRFRPLFGAVPVVLSLDYPAIAQYSRQA